MTEKTHYRKAFNSPYLSSADVVGMTNLTVSKVLLEPDKTNKTKDSFNTAYFVEKEIRAGEVLKPMILNAHNSKMMKTITDSHFIDDWLDVSITIYVDPNVRFGRDTVEGLRIKPRTAKPSVTKGSKLWDNAKVAFLRDGDFKAVQERAEISDEIMNEIVKECMEVES